MTLDAAEYGTPLDMEVLRTILRGDALNQIRLLYSDDGYVEAYLIWAQIGEVDIYLTAIGGTNTGKKKWFLSMPHERAYGHVQDGAWNSDLLRKYGFKDVGPGDPTQEPAGFFTNISELRTYERMNCRID